jgi:hypothetical protein
MHLCGVEAPLSTGQTGRLRLGRRSPHSLSGWRARTECTPSFAWAKKLNVIAAKAQRRAGTQARMRTISLGPGSREWLVRDDNLVDLHRREDEVTGAAGSPPRAMHRRLKSDTERAGTWCRSIRRRKRRLGALRSWRSDRPVRYGRCFSPPTVGTVCTLITGRFAPFVPRAVTPLGRRTFNQPLTPNLQTVSRLSVVRRGEVGRLCVRLRMRG